MGNINKTDKIDYIPLGSVVLVRGGVKKIVVIARGLAVAIESGTKCFDYAGCLYPEGLIGDKVMYFNHADIAKVVFTGFADDDEAIMVENINEWRGKTPFGQGDPYEINKSRAAAISAGKETPR